VKAHNQPEQQLVIANFSKGFEADPPVSIRDPASAITAEFCHIRRGVVEKALGYKQLGNTLNAAENYYLFAQLQLMSGGSITRSTVCVQDETFYELVGATWTSRGSFTGKRYCTAVQYGNRLIISNGSDDPLVWDGTSLQDFNCPAPTSLTHASEEDLGYELVAGDYDYSVSWYDPVSGDESPATAMGTREFQAAGSDDAERATVGATAGVPARFTHIRLYRSENDIPAARYFERTLELSVLGWTPAAGGTVDFGFQADDELLHDDPWDAGAMPKCQILWVWNDIIWGCADPDNPTTIWRSRAAKPWNWQLDYGLNCDKLDGYPLVGLRDLRGRLFAFKKNKVYQIARDPTASAATGEAAYGVKPLPTESGLLCHWSSTMGRDMLWGLGDGQYWRFDGGMFADIAKHRNATLWETYGDTDLDNPLHAAYDRRRSRGMIYMDPGYLIDPDTQGLTFSAFTTLCTTALEGENGQPWVVTDVGSGVAAEMFEQADETVLTDADGSPIYQRYRTAFIDPSLQVPHKYFTKLDLMFLAPDGRNPIGDNAFTLKIYHDDDAVTPSFTQNFSITFGNKSSVIVPFRLDGDHWRNCCIEVRTEAGQEAAFRLAAIRLFWRPSGDAYAR
jgi:hypothetical protein